MGPQPVLPLVSLCPCGLIALDISADTRAGVVEDPDEGSGARVGGAGAGPDGLVRVRLLSMSWECQFLDTLLLFLRFSNSPRLAKISCACGGRSPILSTVFPSLSTPPRREKKIGNIYQ